jgi:hypothetical protein
MSAGVDATMSIGQTRRPKALLTSTILSGGRLSLSISTRRSSSLSGSASPRACEPKRTMRLRLKRSTMVRVIRSMSAESIMACS